MARPTQYRVSMLKPMCMIPPCRKAPVRIVQGWLMRRAGTSIREDSTEGTIQVRANMSTQIPMSA